MDAARRGPAGLERVDTQAVSEGARARLERLVNEWRQRESEARQAMEVRRLQLDSLLSEEVPLAERMQDRFHGFLRGRGFTLLVAVGAALAAWFVMRLALKGLEQHARKSREGGASTRYRVLVYAHRLLTIAVIAGAVLATFSVMGDFLLLTLGLIAVAAALISLRKVLPTFFAEAKLLIGVGPVREGERLVYDGLPYEVRAINVYTILRNPRLEGVKRVPLADVAGMLSRPSRDEPWFPTSKGDDVLLPDDSFGQVLRQTHEYVQLSVLGGMTRLIPTSEFAASGVRNMSEGEAFVIAVTFQRICVDVCNTEGWGIPFAQLTVHAGNGLRDVKALASD